MKLFFWKSLLGLATFSGIIGSTIQVLPTQFTKNKIELKDKSNYAKPIIKKLDFAFSRTGNMTSGQTSDTKVVMILYYKEYANTWQEFINTYSKMKFLNFNAQGGGQGTTTRRTSYEIATKDISFSSVTRVHTYSYRFLVCFQDAIIEFSYKDVNGMFTLSAEIYTNTANAVYRVWVSLSIGDVVFE